MPVRRQRHDAFDALVDTGINQIHRAVDVGLHTFERIKFSSRHNLGGGGVDDIIDSVERAIETVPITDIANQKPDTRVVLVAFCHFPLLHLIARENDDLARIEAVQRHRQKVRPERPGSTGDQNGRIFKHKRSLSIYRMPVRRDRTAEVSKNAIPDATQSLVTTHPSQKYSHW